MAKKTQKTHRHRTPKTRNKHILIPGLSDFLTKLESLEAVDSLLPGPIHAGANGPFRFEVHTETVSGLLCRARSQGTQDVYVVTSDACYIKGKIHLLALDINVGS